ncbi:ImmA/IrrE family metallo-endopeptidase [Pseudoroseicyclus sp. H15]
MEIDLDQPLCPWALAQHLAVPIIGLRSLPDCDERTALLGKVAGHDFSAAACFDGSAAFVLLNDGHDPKRQSSDIAHELAHIILRHPPSNPFGSDGTRAFLPEHEAEAERLGPTLLLSDSAALRAYSLIEGSRFTITELSEMWTITEQVIQMRINLSGAKKRRLLVT